MADDAEEVIGKWTVRVKDWVWEYEFSPGGKVTWRDTRSPEKGSGRWAMTPKSINLSWTDSPVTESWFRPVTMAKQKGWYNASYYAGPYEMQKIVPRPYPTGLDPAVGVLSIDRYVDVYKEIKYDVNFKIPANKSFAFSSILVATYDDGTVVEFDIDTDFDTGPVAKLEMRDIMATAKVGRGNRIMPNVLNSATAPRLWKARIDAFQAQDVEANAFMGVAITGTAFVLSLPAMPAGMMPEAVAAAKGGSRRAVAATKVPPAPIQGNQVQLGPGNMPGSLWASIQETSQGVIYFVKMIFLQGKGSEVAIARATHREMIRRAALAAKARGHSTFKMVGEQAGKNFVRHADELAKEVGVAGSGKTGPGGIPGIRDANYEVILDVAKTLAGN
jgi:hypothetical protein